MKKNLLWMFAAILTCGFTAMTFVSCGDDDDDNKSTSQTPEAQKSLAKTASAWYAVNMGEDMLEVFDVELTIISPSGQSTKKLEKTTYSLADRDVTVKESGLVFGMGVKVTPKAGFKPDTSKTYNLGFGSKFAYYVVNEKNEPLLGEAGGSPVAFSAITYPGSKLADNMARMAETFTTDLEKLEVYRTYYIINGKKSDF